MNRIIRGIAAKKKRKKILKYTKGCFGSHSKLFTTAKQQYMKSYFIAYKDRKKKKRDYRKIWINRIKCQVKTYQLTYNNFIKNLKKNSINLNRKTLAKICLIDERTIEQITNVKF